MRELLEREEKWDVDERFVMDAPLLSRHFKSHRAQRRLREAYFVAIVTPATKQLRKMLADA